MTRFKSIYKDSIEALTLALFALVLFIFISLKVRQIGNAIYPISLLANQHCDTSHGSIVKYNGEWYAFYHNQDLSGQGNLRSICVDKLEYPFGQSAYP